MKGFTLAELLVTIALLATLLTVGVPGFRDMVLNNQRRSISFDLYGDLQFARSQAVARNQRISVCKSADGEQCLAASVGSWGQGWIVYANPGDLDSPADQGAVLAVHDPIGGDRFTLMPIDESVAIRFDFKADGRGQRSGSLRLCHQSASVNGRKVEVQATGNVLIVEDSCT